MSTIERARRSGVCLAIVTLTAACGPGDGGGDAGRVVDADLRIPCGAEGSSGPGDRCACGTECAPGLLCASEAATGLPGGNCVQTCSPASPASCPEGHECVDAVAAAAFCAPRCTTSLECDPGRICSAMPGGGACFPHCDEDRECASGHCHLLSGLCTDGTPRAGAGLDARCTRHEDCESGACSAGRCQTPCSMADAHCPEGAVCVSVFGTDIGVCRHECAPDGSCAPEGTACTTTTTGAMACTPADTCFGRQSDVTDGLACGCDADCDLGATCVPETTFPIPHGGCLRNCDADPSVCGPGTRCELIRAAGMRACIARCANNAECGIGRVCGTGSCEYVCQSDSDCLSGASDLYTGRCGPPASGTLPNGTICTDSGQCRSGLCYTSADPGESFCQSFCSFEAQVCPDGGICVRFAVTYDLGTCMPPCETTDDCPMGATCGDAGLPGESRSACITPQP
jgi:hypothetical protein